jgi:hypothetical protein
MLGSVTVITAVAVCAAWRRLMLDRSSLSISAPGLAVAERVNARPKQQINKSNGPDGERISNLPWATFPLGCIIGILVTMCEVELARAVDLP